MRLPEQLIFLLVTNVCIVPCLVMTSKADGFRGIETIDIIDIESGYTYLKYI